MASGPPPPYAPPPSSSAPTDDIFEVQIPRNVRPGESMTVGLPDGRTHVMVVPPNVKAGSTIWIAVPRQTGVLATLSDGAKRAASAIQKKAKEEKWEEKARSVAGGVLAAGASFARGFQAGFKGDDAKPAAAAGSQPGAAAGSAQPAASSGKADGAASSGQPLPPPPPPPPPEDAETVKATAYSSSAPPPRSARRVVYAIVPPDGQSGTMIPVSTPNGTVRALVPAGVGPGGQFEVPY